MILQISNLYSQEFKSQLFVEDEFGRIDSILIGFDPNASETLDNNFGGIDITDSTWTDFEIRAAQIDVSEIIHGEDLRNPRDIRELTRYQSKIEIIPKHCLEFIPVSNQDGYLPFIAVFIKTNTYPIKLKWNRSEFENNCLSQSVISDWPISTWWDVPLNGELQINETIFSENDEIVITKHTGMEILDENQDTLIMLNILLKDGLGSSTYDQKQISNLEIYPNPTNGKLVIPIESKLLDILDIKGRKINHQLINNEIYVNYEGMMIVVMEYENRIYLKQILNYRR